MNVGDPVTVVFFLVPMLKVGTHFSYTHVYRYYDGLDGAPPSLQVVHQTIPQLLDSYQMCDEGITWIRGHHMRDSAQGRALLTAHALTQR